jgi:hypothetical protein
MAGKGKGRDLSTAAAKAPPSVEMTFWVVGWRRMSKSKCKGNSRSLRDDKQERQRQKQQKN